MGSLYGFDGRGEEEDGGDVCDELCVCDIQEEE